MAINIEIHQLCQVRISGVNQANIDYLCKCFSLCCDLFFPSSLTALEPDQTECSFSSERRLFSLFAIGALRTFAGALRMPPAEKNFNWEQKSTRCYEHFFYLDKDDLIWINAGPVDPWHKVWTDHPPGGAPRPAGGNVTPCDPSSFFMCHHHVLTWTSVFLCPADYLRAACPPQSEPQQVTPVQLHVFNKMYRSETLLHI